MKKSRILILGLAFILLFTSIGVFAESGKETKMEAYNKGQSIGQKDAGRYSTLPPREVIRSNYDGIHLESFIKGYEAGFIAGKSSYGKQLGAALGDVHGERDFKLGNHSNWKWNLPSKDEIKKMYNLHVEGKEYIKSFINDFEESYEKAYIKAFEDANFKPVTSAADKGKNDGGLIGSGLGSMFGKKDAEEGKKLDFTRHLPSDSTIRANYNLDKDTKEYREAFITYFKIAFRESYEDSYRTTNIDNVKGVAEKDGKDKGFKDGKEIGDYYKGINQLKPFDLIKKTDKEILEENKTHLLGKNQAYINDFIKFYQEGFKEGYESVIVNEAVYQEGYNKGYKDGESLAAKSNEDKTFISYEKPKIDRNEAITNNYEALKDKNSEYVMLFIDGYLAGFEKGYKNIIKVGEKIESSETISSNFGSTFGVIHGEIAAIKDYQNGARPDWSRAISKESEIISMFDLRTLPSLEKSNFLEQFRENFQLGYESTYYNAHFGSKKNSMDVGRDDGSEIGELLGKTFGIKDYHEGRSLDYNRNMASESKIRIDYSLNSDNKEYTDGFINGFKNAYQESYVNSFREAKNNVILLEYSSSYENGKGIGELQGKIQGSMDHMEKKSNNWKRSKPLSSSIAFEYNLIYQTNKYRDGFISGFWDGYAAGYNEEYKKLSQKDSMEKTTSKTIPIAGETVESQDSNFTVEIESGIYYKPVIMTIDSLNENYSIDERYISASNFYRLNIVNPSKAFAKDKKLKIELEYYGDKDGGIYQLENGKWTYLTSIIEEGTIVANVNPSTISSNGNVFAVLVDTETEIFHDIRGHWAKDEITAYIRRGVINGYPDNTFKAEQKISRAEFLLLLSRLDEWYMPYNISNNEFFKDYSSFNPYNEKHISYSLSNEYIIGYPDQYFRPYNNISYKEVDIIMKRVLKDTSFKWEKYAEQMMYDKKVRSSSYDSYDNKITRAEFSYMLYKLNEWKY